MNDNHKTNKQKNYTKNGGTGTYIATKVEKVLQPEGERIYVTYCTGSAEIWSGTRKPDKKNRRGHLVVLEPDIAGQYKYSGKLISK